MQINAQHHARDISTLLDLASDVAQSGAAMYAETVAGGSVVGGASTASGNIRVAAWLSSFEYIRRDTQVPSTTSSPRHSLYSLARM